MLFRNTLAQSASFGLSYVFSIVLAPFMIARLGLDAFGVWAVTGAFAYYAGLLDLGVGRSLARFIAIYDAEGDARSVRECVGLGLIVVVVVGAAAALVGAALAPLLSDQLGVLDHGEMRIVLLASIAIWTCNGVVAVLNSVGIGKQQMIPPNVAVAVASTLNFAFSIAALVASSALTVYANANAAAALLGIPASAIALRRVWAAPRFALPSRRLAREVIGFSLKNQLAWFADLINMQTDKLIIAMIVDVHAAAVYEIGSRVVVAVRSAAVMSVSAIVPTAAARMVEEGREAIGPMYRRFLSRSCATAFPLFTLAAVSSPFVLVAWLGDVPGDAGIVIPVLSLAYLVNITTGAGTTLAISYGEPGFAAANSVLIAALNIVLTLALAPFFGLWGVVAGTAAAVVAGSLIFNFRFLRKFDLPSGDFWAGVLPAGSLALGLAIPSAVLAIAVGLPSGRPAGFALLALSVAMFALPYWALATRRGLLPDRLELPQAR